MAHCPGVSEAVSCVVLANDRGVIVTWPQKNGGIIERRTRRWVGYPVAKVVWLKRSNDSGGSHLVRVKTQKQIRFSCSNVHWTVPSGFRQFSCIMNMHGREYVRHGLHAARLIPSHHEPCTKKTMVSIVFPDIHHTHIHGLYMKYNKHTVHQK